MLTNATSKDNNIVPESRSYDTTVATMNPETVDLVDRPEGNYEKTFFTTTLLGPLV